MAFCVSLLLVNLTLQIRLAVSVSPNSKKVSHFLELQVGPVCPTGHSWTLLDEYEMEKIMDWNHQITAE